MKEAKQRTRTPYPPMLTPSPLTRKAMKLTGASTVRIVGGRIQENWTLKPTFTYFSRGSMKVRESGMPEEQMWATFFDADSILTELQFDRRVGDAVEFGCGYGTFTLAAAARARGQVFALDLEPAMIETTERKVREAGLTNVRVLLRDFVAEGTGLRGNSVVYAMLFNILHAEHPADLFREALRVLQPGGRVGVIHWNYDPATPRGPDLTIRPRPEQCQQWAREAGFELLIPLVSLPPYHYGLVGQKPRPPERGP